MHAIVRGRQHELLLVRSTGEENWSLPGGQLLGADPVTGLQRTMAALTGAEYEIGRLLAVDCVEASPHGQPVVALLYAAHPRRPSPTTNPTTPTRRNGVQAVNLPEDEALTRLPEGLRRRVLAAMRAEDGAHTAQLRDGEDRLTRAADVYGTAPAPLVSAALLITDPLGRLLVAQRPYQGGLELPGGLAHAHETPAEAARRGIRETLGLDLTPGRLLAVDHCTASGRKRAVTAHIYTAAPLAEYQIQRITHSGSTQNTAHFLPAQDAIQALPVPLAPRTSAALSALHAGTVAHLENGQAHSGSPAGMPTKRRTVLEQAGALCPEDFLAVRPKALTAATVLFTDAESRVLVVQPTYLPQGQWILPGGGCDSDTGESPRQAAVREVREELGLDRSLGPLLAVDWINKPPHPARVGYVYDGGLLTEKDTAEIRLPERELRNWRFVTAAEVEALLPARLSARVHACLAARAARAGAIELHEGQPRRHHALAIAHTRRRLLLLSQAGGDPPDTQGPWTLPGRHVQPDEHAVEAVQAALRESTGLCLGGAPRLYETAWDRDTHTMVSVFTVPVTGGFSHLSSSATPTLHLVDPSDLASHPMAPYPRTVVDRWLATHASGIRHVRTTKAS
ncbi:NUDIX domain-containing protein [Streptomyces scabiei]|uniref:NUDIX domain-containing protein n=1 Tax=Streptomyces scabiei TaxID=1930 RepID=UPI0029A8678D|nr:NUDIX domain-containing protein [Streptomyces scabiei]MDX3520399.1 NUDIX domain-containing protein [Streptomyces scabiei]